MEDTSWFLALVLLAFVGLIAFFMLGIFGTALWFAKDMWGKGPGWIELRGRWQKAWWVWTRGAVAYGVLYAMWTLDYQEGFERGISIVGLAFYTRSVVSAVRFLRQQIQRAFGNWRAY